MSGKALGVVFAVVVLLLPARSWGQENADCMACHGEGLMGASRVRLPAFQASIHGENLCVSCHADAADLPHAEDLKPVACKSCHRIESQIYMDSDHGRAVSRGLSEAAACKDCHGHSHTLLNSRHPDSPVNRKNILATCARCHADPKRMAKFPLSERDPIDSYGHTVHGEAVAAGKSNSAVCTDCHGSHDLHGAANSASRVFWRNVPETCGRCHANVLSVYAESIHGRASKAGIKESPVCTGCHGEHTIRSPKDRSSAAWSGAVTKTCSGCHSSERLIRKFGLPVDRLKTYMDTYHGLAQQRGDLHVANCASCHGFHDILPHTDPRSSIHRSNLSKTCGKCHPGAGAQLSRGFVHAPPTERHWTLRAAYLFYLIVIPLTIGGMLLHNGLDFLKKLLRAGLPPPHGHSGDDLRMTVNERFQHIVLTAVFVILAYTGFALKYPEAWWAAPMALAAEHTRRAAHRWSALVFCLLGVYHAAYMVLTRRGRRVLGGLMPRPRDIGDTLRLTAYNAGLRRSAPRLSTPYNYIEKSEYWALAWGSVVMVVSGGILVFPDLTLKHFPMWFPELATMVHFYEAVLACLAIAVWHLYWVVFDPSVYPMNWSWITGHVKRLHGKR
ncbi:MAG: cytochrome b/b6 domain-containing protein [Elusimicrobiota bacterium]